MTSPSDATDHPKPVVEPSPATADSTTRALQQRIRQQEILAELGVVALQGKPFLELLSETVRLTAEGMNAEFCKVLEFIPADNRLLVRAGVGWHEGIVGRATVGTYAQSSATWSRRSRLPKSSLMLPTIRFAADRAILVGLIINELVSNAGKYAYPNRARWFDLGAG